jgi:Rrf2 family protein
MRMSQGVEWAVHACTVLAALSEGKALSAAALAEFHGIAAPYMAKQMQLLSQAGLVRTSRGKSGGYALARSAADISLWQVARAIEGPAPLFRCSEIRQRGPCAAAREECLRPCGIAGAFARAEAAWRAVLEATSLADMLVEAMAAKQTGTTLAAAAWLTQRSTHQPSVQT